MVQGMAPNLCAPAERGSSCAPGAEPVPGGASQDAAPSAVAFTPPQTSSQAPVAAEPVTSQCAAASGTSAPTAGCHESAQAASSQQQGVPTAASSAEVARASDAHQQAAAADVSAGGTPATSVAPASTHDSSQAARPQHPPPQQEHAVSAASCDRATQAAGAPAIPPALPAAVPSDPATENTAPGAWPSLGDALVPRFTSHSSEPPPQPPALTSASPQDCSWTDPPGAAQLDASFTSHSFEPLPQPPALSAGSLEDCTRAHTPGAGAANTPGAGIDTPGVDAPGADTSGADTPGVDTPGADAPAQQSDSAGEQIGGAGVVFGAQRGRMGRVLGPLSRSSNDAATRLELESCDQLQASHSALLTHESVPSELWARVQQLQVPPLPLLYCIPGIRSVSLGSESY